MEYKRTKKVQQREWNKRFGVSKVAPIEYLKDREFRKTVSVSFKSQTRDTYNQAHANKT
jgi:hypothetical protein